MACVQVQTSVASEDEAHRMAGAVLEGHLAACVQVVGPVTSRYWWHGRLETATEWLCVAKTTDQRVEELLAAIRAAHAYDVPEIVVTAVSGGDDAYLRWVAEAVEDGRGDGMVGTQ